MYNVHLSQVAGGMLSCLFTSFFIYSFLFLFFLYGIHDTLRLKV